MCALRPDRVHVNFIEYIIVNSPFHIYCVRNQSQKQQTKKPTDKTNFHFVQNGWVAEEGKKKPTRTFYADGLHSLPPHLHFLFPFLILQSSLN